eukprot:m.112834 g.112834  ORF g.112834 m.112834 type:complete len:442 (-) comp12986_c0_seq1:406-1731(-)
MEKVVNTIVSVSEQVIVSWSTSRLVMLGYLQKGWVVGVTNLDSREGPLPHLHEQIEERVGHFLSGFALRRSLGMGHCASPGRLDHVAATDLPERAMPQGVVEVLVALFPRIVRDTGGNESVVVPLESRIEVGGLLFDSARIRQVCRNVEHRSAHLPNLMVQDDCLVLVQLRVNLAEDAVVRPEIERRNRHMFGDSLEVPVSHRCHSSLDEITELLWELFAHFDVHVPRRRVRSTAEVLHKHDGLRPIQKFRVVDHGLVIPETRRDLGQRLHRQLNFLQSVPSGHWGNLEVVTEIGHQHTIHSQVFRRVLWNFNARPVPLGLRHRHLVPHVVVPPCFKSVALVGKLTHRTNGPVRCKFLVQLFVHKLVRNVGVDRLAVRRIDQPAVVGEATASAEVLNGLDGSHDDVAWDCVALMKSRGEPLGCDSVLSLWWANFRCCGGLC